MNPEEPVREANLINLADDETRFGLQYCASDLAADDGLFDQYLRVILPRGLQRAREVFASIDATDTEG